MRRKIITIGVHQSFYDKMEQIRKMYSQRGIFLSQRELTELISKRIRMPKIPDIDFNRRKI